MLKCELCHKFFSHLGSHIWHKHKILAIEYKEMFGLDHKHSLITEEIKEKKRKKFWLNPTLANLGKGTQFKKGLTYKKGYRSAESKHRELENLIKINKGKKGRCPVCNIIFDSLASHLYNKHKLIQANYYKKHGKK